MALTLHIAATEQEAAQSSPATTFDEVLHRQLFDRGLLGVDEFPVLRRMSSPSGDVVYATEDLGPLTLEVASVVARANPILAKQLRQIANAAHEAQRVGKCLFVLAD